MLNEIIRVDETHVKILNPKIVMCVYDSTLIPKHDIGNSGFDLYSRENIQFTTQPLVISTGVKLSLPVGYEAVIRPRSGLAAKLGRGYYICNSPGTIDSIYRGEIKVIADIDSYLYQKIFDTPHIQIGTRIAQLVFNQITLPYNIEYEGDIGFELMVDSYIFDKFSELFPSERQDNGFGSTGLN